MNIRLALPGDLKAVSDLLTLFFKNNAEQQPENYIAAIDSGEYPNSVIQSDSGDFIIAEINNNIVGILHIEQYETPAYPSVKPRKFACIIDFFVLEEHRRKNIGHMLLEKAKDLAKYEKLEYIELMVLENNSIGRNFYEHEDFVTTSRTMRLDI